MDKSSPEIKKYTFDKRSGIPTFFALYIFRLIDYSVIAAYQREPAGKLRRARAAHIFIPQPCIAAEVSSADFFTPCSWEQGVKFYSYMAAICSSSSVMGRC